MNTLNTYHVLIDLIPLQPGGINGGAKIVALNLIQHFSRLVPLNNASVAWRFTLLAAPWNIDELRTYENERVSCYLIPELTQTMRSLPDFFKKVKLKLSKLPFFPSLFRHLKADLLFCPFSNPYFIDSSIPCITLLHDLQHLAYPQFFTKKEINDRNQYLNRMIRASNLIICVSEFSQKSLHQYQKSLPQTTFIYHYFPSEFNCLSPTPKNDRLHRFDVDYGLEKVQYLLYPANYWPHKNHEILLAAYQIYIDRCGSETPLHLVFTGDLQQAQNHLKAKVSHLSLEPYIHFLGYLDRPSLGQVWQHCAGLIFPSLYEGFGLPLVEAMAFQKPILCSEIPSLKEVGADACLYFDPLSPKSIADQLLEFTTNLDLQIYLRKEGQKRFTFFQNLNPVEQYQDWFLEVLQIV